MCVVFDETAEGLITTMSSDQESKTSSRFLLNACYVEWFLIFLLSLMIGSRLTNLDDDHWVSLGLIKLPFSIFIIFMVFGVHKHFKIFCVDDDDEEKSSNPPQEPKVIIKEIIDGKEL